MVNLKETENRAICLLGKPKDNVSSLLCNLEKEFEKGSFIAISGCNYFEIFILICLNYLQNLNLKSSSKFGYTQIACRFADLHVNKRKFQEKNSVGELTLCKLFPGETLCEKNIPLLFGIYGIFPQKNGLFGINNAKKPSKTTSNGIRNLRRKL